MSQLLPMPVVLSIAGFDPSSGAGVSADLKTAAAHGCYGTACITALTVQSTQGVKAVHPLDPALVTATLEELWADMPPAAVRIGMLGSPVIGTAIASFLRRKTAQNVVLDPILRSSSGADLAGDRTLEVLRRELLPLATIVTPNLPEAVALAGIPSNFQENESSQVPALARRLRQMGAANVVITGGHLPENIDFLLTEQNEEHRFPGIRLESRSTHGTGCAFATAVACGLAHSRPIPKAVEEAKKYVAEAIQSAPDLGGGTGPLDHLWPLWRAKG